MVAMLLCVAVAASDPGPKVELIEGRVYVAPALQAGPRSQELSLTFGGVNVSHLESDRFGGMEWKALGVRFTGVATGYFPVALHGVVYASVGGSGFELWP